MKSTLTYKLAFKPSEITDEVKSIIKEIEEKGIYTHFKGGRLAWRSVNYLSSIDEKYNRYRLEEIKPEEIPVFKKGKYAGTDLRLYLNNKDFICYLKRNWEDKCDELTEQSKKFLLPIVNTDYIIQGKYRGRKLEDVVDRVDFAIYYKNNRKEFRNLRDKIESSIDRNVILSGKYKGTKFSEENKMIILDYFKKCNKRNMKRFAKLNPEIVEVLNNIV